MNRTSKENIALMSERFSEGLAAEYAEFLKKSQRGFLAERRTSGKALKLVRVEETEKPSQNPPSQPGSPSEETPAIRAIG